jgi:PAS domain S-box-containing protein
MITLLPIAISMTAYTDLLSPVSGYKINFVNILPQITLFLIFFIILILLMRGYFTASANMMIILSLITIWTVMFLKQSSTLSRLDTIVYIFGIMSLTPLALIRNGLFILFYGGINIGILFALVFKFRDKFNIPDYDFIDYISDNSIMLLFVSITAFAQFTINRRALDTAQKELAERKKAEEVLRESEERLSSFMESAADSFYILDSNMNFVEINKRGLEIIGKNKEDVIGKNIVDIVPDIKSSGRYEKHLEVIRTGMPYMIDHFMPHPVFGNLHFVLNSFKVGEGLGVIAHDITARKEAEEHLRRSLNEKEILIKELHHRVKNNMQVVSSLISLQSQKVDDPKYFAYFMETQNRIHAMSLIHEMLYNSEDMSHIDFSRYLNDLMQYLFSIYHTDQKQVHMYLNVKDIYLGIDAAVPCGMIINELVSNALKHAFPGGREGSVTVDLVTHDDGKHVMTVRDDGVGIPQGYNIETTNSLGMLIVNSLTKQLEGSIEIDRSKGTIVRIKF